MDYFKLIESVEERVLDGRDIEYREALLLMNMEDRDDLLYKLFKTASDIHRKFNGGKVSLCSIVSGKHGSCSEDCKFCAQSAHYSTEISPHSLKNYGDILGIAKETESSGVKRFSIVTSGKKLSGKDLDSVLYQYKRLAEDTELHLCASHGTLGYEELKALEESGVQMYHHNLETGSSYYGEICTTHSYEERVETIKSAKKAGLKVCSGGIFGMGESRKDRIDMLYDLKSLEVDSIPVNILSPVEGTPLESMESISPVEILKTIAVYRIVLPSVEIRYGGGRDRLGEMQIEGLKIGINGMITGNYLTTSGSNISQDKELLKKEKLTVF